MKAASKVKHNCDAFVKPKLVNTAPVNDFFNPGYKNNKCLKTQRTNQIIRVEGTRLVLKAREKTCGRRATSAKRKKTCSWC